MSRSFYNIVEELEEHDPGEHRQAVEVAVEPLVLAHDVARGLDDAAEALRGGGWLRVLLAISLRFTIRFRDHKFKLLRYGVLTHT